MQVELTLHCGKDDSHILAIEDMVISNWLETLNDDACGAMGLVVPSIMEEILKWRANWRGKPDHDEFQNIHDILSPSPAIFTHRRG